MPKLPSVTSVSRKTDDDAPESTTQSAKGKASASHGNDAALEGSTSSAQKGKTSARKGENSVSKEDSPLETASETVAKSAAGKSPSRKTALPAAKGKAAPKSSGNAARAKALQKGFTPLISSETMGKILDTLAACYEVHPMGELTRYDPYKVLVACVLSLRTKDEVTIPASERLFAVADTPEKMVKLSPATIEKLTFPVGFYKTKALTILEFSQRLLDEYDGQVPDTIDELLKFKGVGRKTANLVVGLGFGLPAICVDTHVHRICNRFGYIQTKTPDDTEVVLREQLPAPYWNIINTVLVLHGQQTCKPIGPRCDVCPVDALCPKVDTKPRAVKKKS